MGWEGSAVDGIFHLQRVISGLDYSVSRVEKDLMPYIHYNGLFFNALVDALIHGQTMVTRRDFINMSMFMDLHIWEADCGRCCLQFLTASITF